MKNHTENSPHSNTSSSNNKPSSGLSCKESSNRVYPETTIETSRFDNQQTSNNNGNYQNRKNSDFLEEVDLELSMNFDDSQQEFIPYESVKRFLNEDTYNDNVAGNCDIYMTINKNSMICLVEKYYDTRTTVDDIHSIYHKSYCRGNSDCMPIVT